MSRTAKPDQRVPTADGRPTPLAQLNTELPASLQAARGGLLIRIARLYKKLNLIMAGMYTGVGCSGTPHSHHSYDEHSSPRRRDP